MSQTIRASGPAGAAASPPVPPRIDPTHPYHLFVVEDDVALRDMLCHYFERNGVATTAMGSAEELLHRINRHRPDLILLDVGLPKASGLEACRRLRTDGDRVPIIMLTGHSQEVDRVLGLELGADDYVSKPCSPRELLARTRALLRRAACTPGGTVDSGASVRIGDWLFQVSARSLHRGSEVRMLSTVEYAVLAELTTNAGVPVTRERLVAVSHARCETVSLRAIDATMVRLRRLLEPEPRAPRHLQTVRGHGYVFVPARQPGIA